MDKFFKWVQEMYPGKTDEECMQQLEFLVKQDVLNQSVQRRTTEFTLDGFVYEDTEYLPTYQQPKLKSGDLVRVTEKYGEYIIKECWDKRLSSFIGHQIVIRAEHYNSDFKSWSAYGVQFLIPEDCLELITNKEEYER